MGWDNDCIGVGMGLGYVFGDNNIIISLRSGDGMGGSKTISLPNRGPS